MRRLRVLLGLVVVVGLLDVAAPCVADVAKPEAHGVWNVWIGAGSVGGEAVRFRATQVDGYAAVGSGWIVRVKHGKTFRTYTPASGSRRAAIARPGDYVYMSVPAWGTSAAVVVSSLITSP